MGIKERLEKVRESAKERRAIRWEMDKLSSEMDSIRDADLKILRHDGIETQGSLSNPTQNKAIKIVDDYQMRFDELLNELEKLDIEIDAAREKLKELHGKGVINANEKRNLMYFYIEGLSVAEVALAMNYTVDWIQEMKGKAINNMVTNNI